MTEGFSWDSQQGSFVSWEVDPETGVTIKRRKVVEENALIEIRTDWLGRLERQVWTDGKRTEWELSDKGERLGFFKKVFVDEEKKIGVELAIYRIDPKQVAVNYDECGKLVGIDFDVSSEVLGEYTLFFYQKKTEANGWRVSSFDGNRQKLLEQKVGWGEILRFAGYEYCIEKLVGGRIRVRTGKEPRFTEVEFREQIANEQIFRLIMREDPQAWKKVFELV